MERGICDVYRTNMTMTTKWVVTVRDTEDSWKPVAGWTALKKPTKGEIEWGRLNFSFPEPRYNYEIQEINDVSN